MTLGHLATSGDVLQASLLDGRCAGTSGLKRPPGPTETLQCAEQPQSRGHPAPKGSSDEAEKPWLSEVGGFSKDSSTCKMLTTMALANSF